MSEWKWWRFSQYEIRDGLIGPAEGAAPEQYDPWEEYEKSRRWGGGDLEPPYLSLVRLAQGVSFGVEGDLKPESAVAVLNWCRRYGLLGLLPQFYDVLPTELTLGPNTDPLRATYTWGGGEWSLLLQIPRQPYLRHKSPTWGRARGDGEDLASPIMEVARGEDFASFFPSIPAAKDGYPSLPYPCRGEFFARYHEPVVGFVRTAKAIGDALKALKGIPAEVAVTREESPPDEYDRVFEVVEVDEDGNRQTVPGVHEFWDALDGLNSLTGTVAPVLNVSKVEGRDKLTEQWVFRSLLAAYAMMIHRDLARGARVYICENCKTPFSAYSPKAVYCSLKCRNTAQKRRWRQREKSKRKEAK